MFMLGYAFQKGLVPLSAEAINKAIELNGAAVKMNQAAFLWGRRTAVDVTAVERLIAQGRSQGEHRALHSLDEIVRRRVEFLTIIKTPPTPTSIACWWIGCARRKRPRQRD
jgi:indolepyruvate ferredoxin oxidoreductase